MQEPADPTSLETSILEQLTHAKLEHVSPILSRWYYRDELRALLREDLSSDVRRFSDDELAEQFQHHCPIPTATRDDYKNRWSELPGLGHALTGVRFRGLDMNRPFVEVVATTQRVSAATDMQAVGENLRQAYNLFHPKHVRFFVPEHIGLDLRRWPGAFWEKRYFAAPVEQMRQRAKPEGYGRVALRRPSDMAFYARYQQVLEERFARQPELEEYTRVEVQEDLAEYLEEGTLFEVLVDGSWSGLVGVTRDAEQGLRGFVVIEIVLADSARGQGLGVAVQQRLVEALAFESGDVLYGTIDARNTAAVKTAQRSGRVDLGGFLWLPL